jgi:uncharacterized membrane protein (GlpM family)
MEAPKNGSTPLSSAIRWAARILCALAVAFISLFAFDVFSEGAGIGQKIAAFLLHMIPSFALIIALIVAWKRELVGGIIITLVGLAGTMFVYSLNERRSQSASTGLRAAALIGAPFVIAGILFIVSHFLHRPKAPTPPTP